MDKRFLASLITCPYIVSYPYGRCCTNVWNWLNGTIPTKLTSKILVFLKRALLIK